MREFAALYRSLDETTKTSRKTKAMREYFSSAPPADAAWAVYFLSGYRFKRLLKTNSLVAWCCEAAAVPEWLFAECYDAVGDLAETIALLLPVIGAASQGSLSEWVEGRLRPLLDLDESAQRAAILAAWSDLSPHERFVFNKLVTGGFRVGVSQRLVVRALAEAGGIDPAVVAHRLMGEWQPSAEFFGDLLSPEDAATQLSRPYPFALAHPFQKELETLGAPSDWLLEWKWDGIRPQMIRRQGESFLWSRGEEQILDRFPDLALAIASLPDGTVLDGEIVGWKAGHVLPFADLQRRIGRKKIGPKTLADVPAKFIAFDLLEEQGIDIRPLPLSERRARLEALIPSGELVPDSPVMASPRITATTWHEAISLRDQAREHHVEGLMLKRLDSEYPVGRPVGLWWKWKVDPYTCDAVLIYAQRGNGRRASLYTDYTFGLWHNGALVPVAKAYSGLTDEEVREVDRFVRQNTLEKFGPVRSVKPELVFELAFENIQFSTRHKSGVAVRFPRMARWRHDKRAEEADTLESLKSLIATTSSGR